MKPMKPYIALSILDASDAAVQFELSVLIQSAQGLKLDAILMTTPEDSKGKIQDLIEFHFKEDANTPSALHDHNFVMVPKDQDTVTVKIIVDDSNRPDSGGASSGHYGDPKQ